MKRCKICQSVTISITDVKTGRVYHRCVECDYIYLDEKFHLRGDDERKHYDNHHNNMQSLGYVKMFKRLIKEFVEPMRCKIGNALDFGCGEGEVLPILLDSVGINCDRYDLFYHPKKVYENRKYDLIVSTEVFEHLSCVKQILEMLLTHLNEDGYLLLMTSFHPSNDEEFLKWFYIQDSTHIGFFSMRTFEYLADNYGLKITQHNENNTILLQR